MEHQVGKFPSLQVALKELEQFIRIGKPLRSHPPLSGINQLPRELLGNWLLCAVANAERGKEVVAIYGDPTGGDGILVDEETDEKLFCEHVFAPGFDNAKAHAAILKAFNLKVAKGEQYALGRTLVILNEAEGTHLPAALAREIAGKHHFRGVWLVGLDYDASLAKRYAYSVSDISVPEAPIWRVTIADDFASWSVVRIQ